MNEEIWIDAVVVVSCPGLSSPEQIFSSVAGAQAVGEGGEED